MLKLLKKKKSNWAFKINEQMGICDTRVAGVTDISNSVSTTGFEWHHY